MVESLSAKEITFEMEMCKTYFWLCEWKLVRNLCFFIEFVRKKCVLLPYLEVIGKINVV